MLRTVHKVLFKDPTMKPVLGLLLKSDLEGYVKLKTAQQELYIPNSEIHSIHPTQQIFRGEAHA
ncbi:MAG: hypothetical protein ACLFTR_03410 [Candidatus Woesearchaeota archaeon]